MGYYTEQEVKSFIDENDVKFVRLAFCDIFGTQKNISIIADEITRAFEMGISFDAGAIKGFTDTTHSDLLLFPNPETLAILPWRPMEGRVVRMFCDIKYPNLSPYETDCRTILKNVITKAGNAGYDIKIGAESEFYLFKLDENGNPTDIPFDNASYLDITPLDKGENIRREICLALEDMGIEPVSSHHEQGPGQNEIVFKFSDALQTADNFITFKMAVKAIAARNGLWASFLPKPFADKSGSGLHINLSIFKNNRNYFEDSGKLLKETENFIAGILEHISEITAFLNPINNSYKRLGEFEAPKYISWSYQNRSQLIRIPAASGDYKRIELRSPDGTLNPYLAFALIISAGLDGILNNMPLIEAVNEDLTIPSVTRDRLKQLPSSLEMALNLSKESKFVQSVIPAPTLNKYYKIKIDELKEAFEQEKRVINLISSY